MSPGTAGDAYTHHPVYVNVGGKCSNRYDFFIDPAHIIRGVTFTNQYPARISSPSTRGNYVAQILTTAPYNYGAHDVLFENCTFVATTTTMNGQTDGVLTLGQMGDCYDLTFHNCTVKSNWHGGTDGGANGIKLVDGGGGRVTDVTFAGCIIEPMYRMGFELVDNRTTAVATNIAIRHCTLQPQGTEAMSYNIPYHTQPSTTT